jgi:UDP-N-acetylglucosamine--N-acetylmuramyl-(pentapeptide) pyrophosphoryl-undecaprenol N-acetylglucosamine transferase
VYPALAVLQSLQNRTEAVLWVGSIGGIEADLVQRAGIPFKEIPAAGVHGVGLRALPGNVKQIFAGIRASRRILSEFKPDVLLFTGGYVAVPMALAGYRLESLLYVPDIEPGMALKVLSRFSDQIAITAEESRKFFGIHRHVTVTGYPTRSGLTGWTKESALDFFHFQANQPVILVFGGSKGARSINQAVTAVLPQLLERTQVVHITGQLDWEDVSKVKEQLSAGQASRYQAFPYLHEMGAAFAAADLAISRAGASTLGELPLFALPAVLVPYPYAWRYQKVNAGYLVDHGAAVMLRDEDLKAQLLETVFGLLNDPARLADMGKASAQLAQPDAAGHIASLLTHQADSYANQHGRKNG